MNKYFGTDGFRGEAGVELTAEHAFKIGRFLGRFLLNRDDEAKKRKPRVVIGKDTRLSGYMLEYAIASGLAASGADAYLAHVITTPGLTYLTVKDGFDLGIMITASHNPFFDNGIKVIDSYGEKIDDVTAGLIEEYVDSKPDTLPHAKGDKIGKIHDYPKGREDYVRHLISLSPCMLSELRVGLDSANGAAYDISRSVFESLGAEVFSIGKSPDGMNINRDCGSTHIDALASFVKEKALDLGFAFDGDADRCIATDKNGNTVDGDGIIYVLAKRFLHQNQMQNKGVVVTVMSNGGLIKSLEKLGLKVEITKVGDRFVFERMTEIGVILGGEQSGHIIMRNFAPCGDGLLTAIMLGAEVKESRKSLGDLTAGLTVYPQENAAFYVKNKSLVMEDEELKSLVKKLEAELKLSGGRLIVRASGTEPKIRVMAEAESQVWCKKCINTISNYLREKGYFDGK